MHQGFRIFVLTCLTALPILAQKYSASIDVPFLWGHPWPAHARSLGLAGAYTALSDAHGGLSTNPAGLGLTQRIEVFGTFDRMQYGSEVTAVGKTTEEVTTYTKLSTLGVTIPVPTYRGSLVLGFSYQRHRQFDQSLFLRRFVDRNNYSAAYDSTTLDFSNFQEGGLSTTSLGGAMEVAENLFMGFALNIWSGNREYTDKFTFRDEPYDYYYYSRFDSTTYSDTQFSGLNFTLGLTYRALDRINLAAAITTPVTLKGKENWDETDIRDYEIDSPEYAGERIYEWDHHGYVEYKIRSPWVYRFGGAITQGPLTLIGDIEMVDYSQAKYMTDPPYGENDKIDANIRIRELLKNVKNISFGGELVVPGMPVILRGGYAVIESPLRAHTAKNRTLITFGAGLSLNRQLQIDAAYGMTSWDGIRDELVFSEHINVSKFLLSLTYRM